MTVLIVLYGKICHFIISDFCILSQINVDSWDFNKYLLTCHPLPISFQVQETIINGIMSYISLALSVVVLVLNFLLAQVSIIRLQQ
jgi:hypothetical protein